MGKTKKQLEPEMLELQVELMRILVNRYRPVSGSEVASMFPFGWLFKRKPNPPTSGSTKKVV